jgi:hypothetical protein
MTQARDEAGQQEGLAGLAAAKVEDGAAVVQEKASELREQGSARLRVEFEQRSTQAGSQARALARALRRSGSELSGEGNGGLAQLAGQAAERVDGVGVYLEQKSGAELMREVEMFARRRPWMLAGLGVLAGVAAARFMKASSEQRYGDYRQSSQQRPTRAGLQSPAPATTGADDAELASSGFAEAATVVGSVAPGDAPLARDPYAGTR